MIERPITHWLGKYQKNISFLRSLFCAVGFCVVGLYAENSNAQYPMEAGLFDTLLENESEVRKAEIKFIFLSEAAICMNYFSMKKVEMGVGDEDHIINTFMSNLTLEGFSLDAEAYSSLLISSLRAAAKEGIKTSKDFENLKGDDGIKLVDKCFLHVLEPHTSIANIKKTFLQAEGGLPPGEELDEAKRFGIEQCQSDQREFKLSGLTRKQYDAFCTCYIGSVMDALSVSELAYQKKHNQSSAEYIKRTQLIAKHCMP